MSSENHTHNQRVIVYIDGFNFYFGLKENLWHCYYWLNYQKLAENLVKRLHLDNPVLVSTKYFTARISAPEDKRKRQSDYLEALHSRNGLEIYYGQYRENKFVCTGCKRPNFIPNEKQTDVNIAVQMLADAFEDKFDIAILIGGDSDLVPPIKKIKEVYKEKRVVACFPPKRHSKQIQDVTNGKLDIRESDLKNNLLPDKIIKPDGYILKRPDRWK